MTSLAAHHALRAEDQEFIDNLIRQKEGQPGMLLALLEALQDRHTNRYLPPEVLEYVAQRAGIPASQVFSVATFYALFNLEPQGEHTICICRGTACHTRGSRTLLERVKLQLGIQQGDTEDGADKLCHTTPDRKFTLRTVACFGQCALAPVVEVDHAILSNVSERTLDREVAALKQKPTPGGLQ
jgi:NADH-quinone oxidoreductase subunit E